MTDCEGVDDMVQPSMQTLTDQYWPGYELTAAITLRHGAEDTTLQASEPQN